MQQNTQQLQQQAQAANANFYTSLTNDVASIQEQLVALNQTMTQIQQQIADNNQAIQQQLQQLTNQINILNRNPNNVNNDVRKCKRVLHSLRLKLNREQI